MEPRLRKVFKDCRAQDILEYALMAAFLATMAMSAMDSVARNIRPMFSQVISAVAVAGAAEDPAAAPTVAPR